MYSFRFDPIKGLVPISAEDVALSMSRLRDKRDSSVWDPLVGMLPPNLPHAASAPPAEVHDPMKDDTEWNRTMFSAEKAQLLLRVFEMMQPCINKCIFSRFGNVNEMMLNYCYVYDEVHCIIAKNMKKTGYPPSVFSAAIHQYVMHKGFNKDPTWRILSGVFEYTAMEIAAQLSATSALKAQKEAKERKVSPDDHAALLEWLRSISGKKQPHEMIAETHGKVHATHEKLEAMERNLELILNQIKNMKT